MKRFFTLICMGGIFLCGHAQDVKLSQPYVGLPSVNVIPVKDTKYNIRLQAFSSCGAVRVERSDAELFDQSETALNLHLNVSPQPNDRLCLVETFEPKGTAPPKGPLYSAEMVAIAPEIAAPGKHPCALAYSDCNWGYTALGGVEQSDLSSQASQTDGFVDLFVRGPMDSMHGDAWLQVRFLGAPTTDNTQNIAAAVTNPDGGVTASALSTVGYAVDYAIGYEYTVHPGRQFTFAPMLGFGATTPLSSQSATVAYVVPAYGTNECTTLLSRFTTEKGYNPPLPGSAAITTTTTTNGVTTQGSSTPTYCSVQNIPTSTVSSSSGVTTTTTTSGTQITDIAFTPQDRSSFLLKWGAGVRLITRFPLPGFTSCNATDSPLTDSCSRSMIDFTLGQDQEITGGTFKSMVFKANAEFPIPKTSLTIFLSSATRLERNQNYTPLLLTPAPIFSGSGTPPTGSITVPSSSVFVLPLRQADRDFYRIGIAVNLAKVLPNLFKPAQ